MIAEIEKHFVVTIVVSLQLTAGAAYADVVADVLNAENGLKKFDGPEYSKYHLIEQKAQAAASGLIVLRQGSRSYRPAAVLLGTKLSGQSKARFDTVDDTAHVPENVEAPVISTSHGKISFYSAAGKLTEVHWYLGDSVAMHSSGFEQVKEVKPDGHGNLLKAGQKIGAHGLLFAIVRLKGDHYHKKLIWLVRGN